MDNPAFSVRIEEADFANESDPSVMVGPSKLCTIAEEPEEIPTEQNCDSPRQAVPIPSSADMLTGDRNTFNSPEHTK